MVGGTSSPRPRRTAGPVASQRTLRLTVAATLLGPRNWKLLTRHTSVASRVALRPSWLTRKALSGSSTTQNRPDGWMPPL